MVAKKAVLIGNNYPGTKAELKGCVNDVMIMRDILIKKKGFKEQDIIIMIDTDPSYTQPTGENIRKAFEKLCTEAEPGDYIFMHFSGHGTQVPSTSETDWKNEALCPTDMNLIVDDDLKEIASSCKKGVYLTVVTDCCHSGGMLDNSAVAIEGDKATPNTKPPAYTGRELPIETVAAMLSQELGKLVTPNGVRGALSEKYGQAASNFAIGLYENYTKKKIDVNQRKQVTSFVTGMFKKFGLDGDEGESSQGGHGGPPSSSGGSASGSGASATVARPAVDKDVGVLITGCQSDETSADVRAGGTAYGALTKNIEQALEKDPHVSYYELVMAARHGLAEGGFTQNPCLECTDDNAKLPFICPSV